MTPEEHRLEAERLLSEAKSVGYTYNTKILMCARANVHATLSLGGGPVSSDIHITTNTNTKEVARQVVEELDRLEYRHAPIAFKGV